MTARSHSHPRNQARPLRTRVFVIAVVLCCAGAASISLFERKELPEGLRDNPYVETAYRIRDKTMQKGEEWLHRKEAAVDPEEASQQGNNKDDRKKLETLISKGAQEQ